MIIKSDFITNSSSSSFIVAFPKKIKTIEDALLYISPNLKAEQIFKDAIEQDKKVIKIDPNDKDFIEELATELSYGYIDDICYQLRYKQSLAKKLNYDIFEKDFIKRHNITRKELDENYYYKNLMYNEKSIYSNIIAKEIAVKFSQENKDHFFYKFDYGDDSGEFFLEMEHGNTFSKVPHIKISKH